MTLNEAVDQWNAIREEAARMSALERQWRDYVNQLAQGKETGTTRIPLGNSRELKVVRAMRREIKADYGTINDVFTRAQMIVPDLALRGVLRWKPALNSAAYDALPDAAKRLIEPLIVMSPNTPQISIEDKT